MDDDGAGGGGGGGRKRQRMSSKPTAPPPGESLQLAGGERVKAGTRVKFLLPGRREPSFGKLRLDTGGGPTHAGSPHPRSPPPSLTTCLPAASPTSEKGTVWTIVKEQKEDRWEPQRASDSTNRRALASLKIEAAPKGELDTHGPCFVAPCPDSWHNDAPSRRALTLDTTMPYRTEGPRRRGGSEQGQQHQR